MTVLLGPIQVDDTTVEAAARHMSRAEGFDPDKATPKGRPHWQVYAEMIREQFLPALNHALTAGLPPEPGGTRARTRRPGGF